MEALILIAGGHALFLALLLLTKRARTAADGILALLLALYSATFLFVYVAERHDAPGALLLLFGGNLLLSPLYYLYVASATRRAPTLSRALLHFVPYLLSSFTLLALLDGRSDAQVTRLFDAPPGRRPLAFDLAWLADLLVTPVYLVAASRLLVRHRARVDAAFSWRERVDLRWLSYVTLAMGLTWLLVEAPLLASTRLGAWDEAAALRMGFALSALVVIALGVLGFRQAAVFVEPPAAPPGPQSARYARSGLGSGQAGAEADRLRRLMEEERLYLDAELRVDTLAGRAGLTVHNLSQVLNDELGQSFHDFVNRYRVEAVERRLRAGDSAPLLTLALQAGFRSKSSFNRAFKRVTGRTPSEYARAASHPSG